MSRLIEELKRARGAAGLTHQALADSAGLSRMAVQRIEAEGADPKLSTLLVLARSMGMDLMLVPLALRADLEDFVRSGGRVLGQEPGIGAPASIVDDLIQANKSPK